VVSLDHLPARNPVDGGAKKSSLFFAMTERPSISIIRPVAGLLAAAMFLRRVDDTPNSDLITSGGRRGLHSDGGSLCRFGTTASGDNYKGVTGFRAKFPPGCDRTAPPGHPNE
jgi:hypothetical protein